MLKFHDYSFFDSIQMSYKHHQKTQNHKYIYMEFNNIKQGETQWVEVYYEHIQKLAHGLQTPTTYSFFTIMFWAWLQPYLNIATIAMKWTTLQQHKEATHLCEEGMTPIEAQIALSIP
jgi:hypothetical protein